MFTTRYRDLNGYEKMTIMFNRQHLSRWNDLTMSGRVVSISIGVVPENFNLGTDKYQMCFPFLRHKRQKSIFSCSVLP